MYSLETNRTRRAPATLALTASLAALAALAACGSSSGTTAGTGGGGTTSSHSASSAGGGATTSTSTTATTGPGGSGGAAPTCPGPGFGGGEKLVSTGYSVTATIVDQNGAPVVGQPLYICGIDICSNPAKTDPTGKATITTNLPMKKAAFKFGDAVTYAELAIPLSMMANAFMTVGTGKLPAAGAALTPGADAVSGGVTLSLPKGASVGIDGIVYDTPDKQKFRAVSIPLTNEGAVLAPITFPDAGAGFGVLYGVSPSETLLCPAAKVTVPNTAGWAAKAAVEFWIMTIDVGQSYAPYAGWAKASDGVVSDDGTTVSTLDSGGFLTLENFGVRLKP